MDAELFRMQLAKMDELVKNMSDHLETKDDDAGLEMLDEIVQQHLLLTRIMTDDIESK